MYTKIWAPAVMALLTSNAAFAMSEALAELDTTGDGMIGLDELQVAFPEITGDDFLTMDGNGDGLLDVDEVTAAETAGLLPTAEG